MNRIIRLEKNRHTWLNIGNTFRVWNHIGDVVISSYINATVPTSSIPGGAAGQQTEVEDKNQIEKGGSAAGGGGQTHIAPPTQGPVQDNNNGAQPLRPLSRMIQEHKNNQQVFISINLTDSR